MVGSEIREGNGTYLSEFTCQNGTIALVALTLVALSWLSSCLGLNSVEILFRSFALVG
jgi:hypothetical protein